jgi:hypothetical protein
MSNELSSLIALTEETFRRFRINRQYDLLQTTKFTVQELFPTLKNNLYHQLIIYSTLYRLVYEANTMDNAIKIESIKCILDDLQVTLSQLYNN